MGFREYGAILVRRRTNGRRRAPSSPKAGGPPAGRLLILPVALLLVFFVLPLLQSFVNSLHPFTPGGIDTGTWTLDNYRKALEPFYLGVLWRTIRVGLLITAISLLIGYPAAYHVARLPGRAQSILLLVFIAPWLVNVTVKAFGWTMLLSTNGFINRGLKALGLIERSLPLMFSETGIVIGLVHGHLMFVILPLVASLTAIDQNVVLAAANLGARRWHVFWRIVFPLSLPGLLAGAIINLTMNMAAFVTPALLGGSRVRLISYVAYEQNLVTLNWPFGAALAVGLLVVTTSMVLLSQRLTLAGKRRGVFR